MAKRDYEKSESAKLHCNIDRLVEMCRGADVCHAPVGPDA
jgi:hypothetical protein